MKAEKSAERRQKGDYCMNPSRERAQELLTEAAACNPGPWERHSYLVARCAERIAQACGDMDPERAYVLGLLHDIGRKFGVSHLRHVYDGWTYLKSLGYEEAAKSCLTHSFCLQRLEDYVGRADITKEQRQELENALAETVYDDYDRLIQLCDSLAGGEAILSIEERMLDVKRRYGGYPQDKWDKNLELKDYFEKKAGRDIYEVVGRTL